MVFDTNKEKGNSGLGMAIAYYSCNGYIVSVPLNDTQDYDLIVDKEYNRWKQGWNHCWWGKAVDQRKAHNHLKDDLYARFTSGWVVWDYRWGS